MENKERPRLFALDIGTRSVVGLVGEREGLHTRILGYERQEHHTRSMMDGQIHDVQEVSRILASVKERLEEEYGSLTQVSIAAAGRALCTIRSEAEIETNLKGPLSADDVRTLELAAIQTAQQQLSTSKTVKDPTDYYCVGYSVMHYSLDDTQLSCLVGQTGKNACVELIATFLPRQVIDSLQTAVQQAGMEIATLTLEPIAAINVLIPPTMRHLNLTLVDVGAGTSDVAITRDGTVIGYGMVPSAGDEITEAISQQYLLDFNVAEEVKRSLNEQKEVRFHDILGLEQVLPSAQITETILPQVTQLANDIAAQILELNAEPPQAVLLVGGGSLTPQLPQALAQALNMPPARVAIRRPDMVQEIMDIPEALHAPDAITPLGILKLASGNLLHFVHVTLNDRPLRLFNLGQLTVADALLVAGFDIRTLKGRPGLGITVTVNGQKHFLPGSAGAPGTLALNGQPATVSDLLHDDDTLTAIAGTIGSTPQVTLADLADLPPELSCSINGRSHIFQPVVTINQEPASVQTVLKDRDVVAYSFPPTLRQVLKQAGHEENDFHFRYFINGQERTYTVWPEFFIGQDAATLETQVSDGANIRIVAKQTPKLEDVLGLRDTSTHIQVQFNGTACKVPTCRLRLHMDGRSAQPGEDAPDGSHIEFQLTEALTPIISDVLLAAEFDAMKLPLGKINILCNNCEAELTTPVKNGDAIRIESEPLPSSKL